MQNLFNTTRMFPEDWITPGGLGGLYTDAMGALHSTTGVFEALGNASIYVGLVALMAIPLVWALARLNRV